MVLPPVGEIYVKKGCKGLVGAHLQLVEMTFQYRPKNRNVGVRGVDLERAKARYSLDKANLRAGELRVIPHVEDILSLGRRPKS